MKKNQHQSLWEWMKGSLVINIFFVIFAGFAGYSAYSIFGQAFAVRREYQRTAGEIEALRAKKVNLEARIRELASPQALEREGKEFLNLKMPGEEVVVVVPEEEEAQEAELSGSWWERVRRMFGGK